MNATPSKLLIPEAMTQLMTHPELEPHQVQAANVSNNQHKLDKFFSSVLPCSNRKWQMDWRCCVVTVGTHWFSPPNPNCTCPNSPLQCCKFASFAAPLVRELKQLFMMSQWAAIHPLFRQNPHAGWVHFLCNYKHEQGPTRTWVSAGLCRHHQFVFSCLKNDTLVPLTN